MDSLDAKKFLANGRHLILPTLNEPRVYLNIENNYIAEEAFKLYNPFSVKAKVLKSFTKFLCVRFNALAKVILPTIRSEKSVFIGELEDKLGKKIQSSIYISTARDKIVLQLQEKGVVLGYLKYAISPIGAKRVLNEKQAVKMLSDLNLIPNLVQEGSFENMPFIVLQNLEGSIGLVESDQYQIVLDSLKKPNTFKLIEHPRVLSMKQSLKHFHLEVLSDVLNHALRTSDMYYHEVFEHGDFAPWNLIRSENKIIPFDLEYFEEKGLQYLDNLKYHYQVGHLLKRKKGKTLIEFIRRKVQLVEFNSIFLIFLVKEIINKIEFNESYQLEKSLLNLSFPEFAGSLELDKN